MCGSRCTSCAPSESRARNRSSGGFVLVNPRRGGVLCDAAGLHAVEPHAPEAETDDRPRRLGHEAFAPLLAREDVAQLAAGVLGRVACVYAAGADERAAVLEDDAPAAEVAPLVALRREAEEALGVLYRAVGSHRTLLDRNTISFRATPTSDGEPLEL